MNCVLVDTVDAGYHCILDAYGCRLLFNAVIDVAQVGVDEVKRVDRSFEHISGEVRTWMNETRMHC